MFDSAALIIITFTGAFMLGMMYRRLIIRWKEMAKVTRETFERAVKAERERKEKENHVPKSVQKR